MDAGSSHGTTQALVAQAKEKFEDAYRAFEQLQTLIQDDQTGMWTALHVADDTVTDITSSVHAAFSASSHGPRIDDIIALTLSVTNATTEARAALNSAVAQTENGKTATQQGITACEELITYLASIGE